MSREVLVRLWNLLRRSRLERELEIELRHHLESLEAEYRARGLSANAARAAARRDFGGVLRTQEEYREQGGIPMLETVWRNVRFSMRSMTRTPVVTVAVIATLALGIGATTAIFSVLNSVLIKPLPYPDSERLIVMSHTAPGVNVADVSSAPFLYFTEREENRTLDGVGLFNQGSSTLTGRGEPEVVRRLFVTSDILPMLGIQPLVGRYFTESDDAPASPNTVVLTYGFWHRKFGGDRSAVGQSITLNGEIWNVIGVMPQRFRFLDSRIDVITPLRMDRNTVTVGNYFRRSIARLKPGVTLEQASADVRRMIPLAIDAFPPGRGSTRQQALNSRLGPNLRPLKQEVVGNIRSTLWVLTGTLGLMLLIACANVANLILARTENRQQELSIRAAMGAGWRRITGELLTESALLSLIGGGFGIGAAYSSVRLLRSLGPASLPRLEEITVDVTVVIFGIALAVLASLLLGVIPVIRYGRPRVLAALRTEGRWSTGNQHKQRTRGFLVVVQVALALILLIGAGLMIRTFNELNNVSPGFSEAEEVQTLQIQIPQASFPELERMARKQQEIRDRLAALPGVNSAAYISDVPMGGGVAADLVSPEGKIFRPGEPPRSVQSRFVSPGVFETLRIPVVRGRDFTWTDIYERRPVVLVSEDFARLEWGDVESALGNRIRGASAADQWREIIGVVGAVHDRGLNQPALSIAYYPVFGERVYNNPVYVWPAVTYVIRSQRAGSPDFLDEIRRAVWAVDSSLPVVNPRTMADVVKSSLTATSFTMALLAIAGGMALLLGLIGVYAVIAYAVSKRTREVGIRVALGAQSAEVRGMFVRQGLAMTAIGIAVGLIGAAGLTRWMKTLLFEVSPVDPFTYAVVSLLLLAAAALACYLPARRASRVDPIVALRVE